MKLFAESVLIVSISSLPRNFSVAHLTLPSGECESKLLRSWGSVFSLFLYIRSGFFFCLYPHVNILDGKNDRLLAQSQFALHITSLPILLKKDVFLYGRNKHILVVVKKKEITQKTVPWTKIFHKGKYTWFLLWAPDNGALFNLLLTLSSHVVIIISGWSLT